MGGTVRSTPGYEKMRMLPSFVALQTGVTVGTKVELTVDLFTAVGVLVLANTDQKRLEADLAEVRKMEKEGLFTFDEEVDPVQAEPSPDTIIPAGRKRTGSFESTITLMEAAVSRQSSSKKAPERGQQQIVAMTVAAFAAGTLFGLLVGKRTK